MNTYLELLRRILHEGVERPDRTGTGTLSVFGVQLRFALEEGFPLVTTKKMHVPAIVQELLWFLRGETNVRSLQQAGVTIWDEWADAAGDLGPIYGAQWRTWRTADGHTIDQLARVVDDIRTTPHARRHLVSAWNVGQLHEMALPPCHYAFQFYVAQGRLSCMFTMRSVDTFLGLPFNIASYALLTHMVAQQCDLGVGELVFSGADVHVYMNHVEQVQVQLQRVPYPLPTLHLMRKPPSLFEYTAEDIVMRDYVSHPRIVAPISV